MEGDIKVDFEFLKKMAKKNKIERCRGVVAGLLFGIGLGLGFIPIALASILIKHNLFTECIDRMDEFWKKTR